MNITSFLNLTNKSTYTHTYETHTYTTHTQTHTDTNAHLHIYNNAQTHTLIFPKTDTIVLKIPFLELKIHITLLF